jgi:hypothetical protein
MILQELSDDNTIIAKAILDAISAAIFMLDAAPTDDEYQNVKDYVIMELSKTYDKADIGWYFCEYNKKIKQFYYDTVSIAGGIKGGDE